MEDCKIENDTTKWSVGKESHLHINIVYAFSLFFFYMCTLRYRHKQADQTTDWQSNLEIEIRVSNREKVKWQMHENRFRFVFPVVDLLYFETMVLPVLKTTILFSAILFCIFEKKTKNKTITTQERFCLAFVLVLCVTLHFTLLCCNCTNLCIIFSTFTSIVQHFLEMKKHDSNYRQRRIMRDWESEKKTTENRSDETNTKQQPKYWYSESGWFTCIIMYICIERNIK